MSRLFHFFLKRRYRVTIIGEENLKLSGGKLLLPNHPAQIDAQLLAVITNKNWEIVPVVAERFVQMPVVGYFLKSTNAIPVSDLSKNRRDPEVLQRIVSGALEAFKMERSVIIYPAGSIKLNADERISNKQSAYQVARQMPDNVKIIGVRINGLWGSMWSVAYKGRKPNFGLTLLKGIGYMFANLIFLLPKRDVTMEFVEMTEEIRERAKGDRRSFNRYLEEFYNIHGPEKEKYVRHFFFLPLIRFSKKKE